MQSGFFVFLASISIGIPSVLALYVADAVLTSKDLSTFIKVWALTNTLIVGVTSPLITYAPNLRMDFKSTIIPTQQVQARQTPNAWESHITLAIFKNAR